MAPINKETSHKDVKRGWREEGGWEWTVWREEEILEGGGGYLCHRSFELERRESLAPHPASRQKITSHSQGEKEEEEEDLRNCSLGEAPKKSMIIKRMRNVFFFSGFFPGGL